MSEALFDSCPKDDLPASCVKSSISNTPNSASTFSPALAPASTYGGEGGSLFERRWRVDECAAATAVSSAAAADAFVDAVGAGSMSCATIGTSRRCLVDVMWGIDAQAVQPLGGAKALSREFIRSLRVAVEPS